MLNVDDWKGTLRHAQFRAAACRSRTIKMSLCFYQTLILFFNRLECIHSTNEPHLVALCIGSPCVVVYFSDFIGWNRWRSPCDPAREGGYATHVDQTRLQIFCKGRQHCNCTDGLIICRGRGVSFHGFFRVCRGLSVYFTFVLQLSGEAYWRLIPPWKVLSSRTCYGNWRAWRSRRAQSLVACQWWQANKKFYGLCIYSQQLWQSVLYLDSS